MNSVKSRLSTNWLSLSALLVAAQVTACAANQEETADGDDMPSTGAIAESSGKAAESSVEVPESTTVGPVVAQDVKVDHSTMAAAMTAAVQPRVPTVEVTASGELLELDDEALLARGIGARFVGSKLPDGPVRVAAKSCVDVESGEHVCPDSHPNHRLCPTNGLPKTANCVTSHELPLLGQQSWCCQ